MNTTRERQPDPKDLRNVEIAQSYERGGAAVSEGFENLEAIRSAGVKRYRNEQHSDNRCDQSRDMETNNIATTAAINRATFKRTTISDIMSQSLVNSLVREFTIEELKKPRSPLLLIHAEPSYQDDEMLIEKDANECVRKRPKNNKTVEK
ncbi:hypothetical protein YC2023_042806 [Brassica napus]